MNNFAKHSQGDTVFLSLGKAEGAIRLEIRDNGIGFDLEKVPKGLGINSMKERTELSGGVFTVESARGLGTNLKASWPLSTW
jgi:signal transduction histidine kinase